MTRWFILTRIRASSHEEAVRAFREAAERQGYTVIRVGCHPTHLPGEWEGAVEIADPEEENEDGLPSQGRMYHMAKAGIRLRVLLAEQGTGR
jgi:hypothetical protein